MAVSADSASPLLTAPHALWRSEDAGCLVTVRNERTVAAPGDWLDRFASYLRDLPNLGLVGAKRISVDRKLVSMGEFIIHPKGCHSLGEGLSADAFRFPEEVGAVAGDPEPLGRSIAGDSRPANTLTAAA